MSPNAKQTLAIRSPEKRRVVLASPGSGKTLVLVGAIKQRLDEGISPKRIACLTYTNAAAHVMAQRLGVQLGYCGTLHGFCFRLLQRFGDRIGYKPGSVSILPEDEKERLVVEIAANLGLKTSKTKLFGHPDLDDENISRVWEEYYFRLKTNNLVDYDGILTDAIRLGPDVLAEFDEAFIDECQDSSRPDWAIYKHFEAKRIFVVGDVDQCIFSFRNADPRLLLEVAQDSNWQLITLETNYRSDTKICAAATNLIKHNTNRVPKDVVPHSTVPGEVHVTPHLNEFDELLMICGKIQRWQAEGASVAVLYRTNHLANQARTFLAANGVIVDKDRSIMPHDWKLALVLVSLCVDPHNGILAEKYLRMLYPDRPDMVRKTVLEAQAAGESVMERMVNRNWPKDLGDLPRRLAQDGISQASVALILQRVELLPPDAGLTDLLHDVYSHEDWQEEKAADGCFISTIHAAKGKEFDVVFLPAFEEGTIPKLTKPIAEVRDKDAAKELEEDRRVAFVGVTRARHQLYISYADQRRPKWGDVEKREPSRFIKEMEPYVW